MISGAQDLFRKKKAIGSTRVSLVQYLKHIARRLLLAYTLLQLRRRTQRKCGPLRASRAGSKLGMPFPHRYTSTCTHIYTQNFFEHERPRFLTLSPTSSSLSLSRLYRTLIFFRAFNRLLLDLSVRDFFFLKTREYLTVNRAPSYMQSKRKSSSHFSLPLALNLSLNIVDRSLPLSLSFKTLRIFLIYPRIVNAHSSSSLISHPPLSHFFFSSWNF